MNGGEDQIVEGHRFVRAMLTLLMWTDPELALTLGGGGEEVFAFSNRNLFDRYRGLMQRAETKARSASRA